ncbi:MAG: hypothetical protein AAF197_10400, partial [Pseudomonadota bacterium]
DRKVEPKPMMTELRNRSPNFDGPTMEITDDVINDTLVISGNENDSQESGFDSTDGGGGSAEDDEEIQTYATQCR